MITLPITLVRGRRGKMDEVTVYSAHPSFFLWLLIAVGFTASAIVARYPQEAGLLGWIYVWALLYFLVTLMYDISARKLGLWTLIFALIWLGSKYVEHIKNVAVLGSVFGIGCGTNTNLTYSGASSWLAGIPTTRRAKVNYYTTSFTDRSWVYDYCNMATDVLLSDPEDGTTEKAKGQLSGAINQGHKSGW